MRSWGRGRWSNSKNSSTFLRGIYRIGTQGIMGYKCQDRGRTRRKANDFLLGSASSRFRGEIVWIVGWGRKIFWIPFTSVGGPLTFV